MDCLLILFPHLCILIDAVLVPFVRLRFCHRMRQGLGVGDLVYLGSGLSGDSLLGKPSWQLQHRRRSGRRLGGLVLQQLVYAVD